MCAEEGDPDPIEAEDDDDDDDDDGETVLTILSKKPLLRSKNRLGSFLKLSESQPCSQTFKPSTGPRFCIYRWASLDKESLSIRWMAWV